MNPMEIALGWLEGWGDHPPEPTIDEPVPEPRTALQRKVLTALQHPPCGVAFSGGRDSSTLLAIAVDLARREGLATPIPVTTIHPDAPETDESDWQELVIGHLDIDDWVRLTLHDELDIIGPLATPLLRRHGVFWPPMLYGDIPLLEVLRGGTLLTGEGGDEVLGIDDHRIAPFTRVVRSPRTFQRRHLKQMAVAVTPARVRAHRDLQRPDTQAPWLKAPARAEMRAVMLEQQAAERLSYAASVRAGCRIRANVLADRNEDLVAREYDVELMSPFTDPFIVESLARDGGRLGRGDRTTVLRWLVGDLLPDAVLSRTSKALFNDTFLTDHTREFARRWSGAGVDPELVDVGVLRERWMSEDFEGLAASLLQAAWLATDGTP